MKKNKDLKKIYNKALKNGKEYSGGKDSFFTFPTDDVSEYILSHINFKDYRVLELGCGTGKTANAIATSGAKYVLAIDFSEEAIKTCTRNFSRANLDYQCQDITDIDDVFDIIVMQEVIEHVDDPEDVIMRCMNHLNDGGKLVLTCPNFLNIRGYIWMTLQILFDVRMSLSDLHFLSPFDFVTIASKYNFNLEWSTFAHDRVNGEKMIYDMRKRLTNALRDAHLDNKKVDSLLEWVAMAITYDNVETNVNGGKGFYVFEKKTEGQG